MRILSSLPAAIAIGASIFCAIPAKADLGAADSNSNKDLSGKSHKAFCGNSEKNVNCTITFEDNRLKVDDSDGILSSQIREVLFIPGKVTKTTKLLFSSTALKGDRCGTVGIRSYCQLFYEINYQSSSGESKWVTIRFSNKNSSASFRSDIEAWSGLPLRLIDANVKIVR